MRSVLWLGAPAGLSVAATRSAGLGCPALGGQEFSPAPASVHGWGPALCDTAASPLSVLTPPLLQLRLFKDDCQREKEEKEKLKKLLKQHKQVWRVVGGSSSSLLGTGCWPEQRGPLWEEEQRRPELPWGFGALAVKTRTAAREAKKSERVLELLVPPAQRVRQGMAGVGGHLAIAPLRLL